MSSSVGQRPGYHGISNRYSSDSCHLGRCPRLGYAAPSGLQSTYSIVSAPRSGAALIAVGASPRYNNMACTDYKRSGYGQYDYDRHDYDRGLAPTAINAAPLRGADGHRPVHRPVPRAALCLQGAIHVRCLPAFPRRGDYTASPVETHGRASPPRRGIYSSVGIYRTLNTVR
jgi:hypothetical protein